MHATCDDYLNILQQLLPPGAAWPRDNDAVLTKLLTSFADGLARAHNQAVDMMIEVDPRQATMMLSDFEILVGPDTCIDGGLTTLAERRAFVHARWTARGGQSRAFFIALAEALGYTVTITEHRPFTCDSPCDQPIYDQSWRFVWKMNAPAETIREFTCDSGCDEPLRTWGNELLECAIRRASPAHTTVYFTYGDI